MSIIRVVKPERYSIISNDVLTDSRLSWEARGLMAYLLSKPNNWTIRQVHLIKQGPAGDRKMRRIFNELIDLGYMRSNSESRDEKGRFTSPFTVYENPDANPDRPALSRTVHPGRFIQDGSSRTDNAGVVNTDLPKTDQVNTDLQSSRSSKSATAANGKVRSILEDAGIREPTLSELLALHYMRADYVQAHVDKAKREKADVALLIHRFRSGDPMPRVRPTVETYSQHIPDDLKDVIQR